MQEDSAIHLLPLPTDPRQHYDLAHSDTALTFNCAAQGFDVVHGEHGRALVARRAFKQGAIAGYMWGKLVSEEVHAAIYSTSRDPTHHEGEEDYAMPMKQGVWRTVETGDAGSLLLVSGQCPMSLINHSSDASRRNVSIDLTQDSYRVCALTMDKADLWRSFPIVVKQPICIGEQIFADYGWKEKDWQYVKRLHRRQRQEFPSPSPVIQDPLPTPRSAPSLLHVGSLLYNLKTGIGTFQDCLKRQTRELEAFVDSMMDTPEMRNMPYDPRMVSAPTNRVVRPLPMEIRQSSLGVPGLLGIFPVHSHPDSTSRDNRSDNNATTYVTQRAEPCVLLIFIFLLFVCV
jgi:hypothetical protein